MRFDLVRTSGNAPVARPRENPLARRRPATNLLDSTGYVIDPTAAAGWDELARARGSLFTSPYGSVRWRARTI